MKEKGKGSKLKELLTDAWNEIKNKNKIMINIIKTKTDDTDDTILDYVVGKVEEKYE